MDDKLFTIFAYFIIGYIFISLFLAALLLIYNFILVPLAQSHLPKIVLLHTHFVQQINSLNISPSENEYLLSIENDIYQRTIQNLQSYTPIPTDQLIKAELILIGPPVILLGLIYYVSKRKNDDD